MSQPLEGRPPADLRPVQAPLEVDPVHARRAIEALRAGVPNQDAVRLLRPQQPQIETRFQRQLGASTSNTSPWTSGSCAAAW